MGYFRWPETTAERVVAGILILGILGILGALIWDYPTWIFSVIIAVTALIDLVLIHRRRPGIPTAQENDPNRR